MLSVCGTADANVYSYIQHGTQYTAHQLGLGVGRMLEMQAADDAARTHAFIILYEMYDVTHLRIEVTFGETLEEIAPRIAEHTGFQH